MADSARVEKGSHKLNRYRTYIGFLKGRSFQGKDFMVGDWWDLKS